MGVLDFLGLGKNLAAPIDAASKFYTTDKERLEAANKSREIESQIGLEQQEINKILSRSENFFNSGWIPLVGWSIGFLILLFYAPQIMVATYVWAQQCIARGIVTPFPMAADDILNLVYLLLGFGGYSLVKKKI